MRSAASLTAIAATLLLTACGGANAKDSGLSKGTSEAAMRGPAGDYPMILGEPFTVDGVTYTPADTLNYDSVGYAHVESGEGVSGSHRTLPLPSYVEVTSLDSGRTILVRMTERGPMTGSDLVTLSPGAWAQLGMPAGSRLPVRVRRVNPPEPERALLRAGTNAPARMDTPQGLLTALKRKLGVPIATPAPFAAAPVAKIEPKVSAKAAPVAKAIAKPAEKPVAMAKVEPKIAEKPAPAPAPAAEASGLYVQAGAYSSKARADAVAKAIGGSASSAGRVWRVRVGPHKYRGQADAALAKVRAAGYADARVVTAP
ncbi:MAG: SPOR domain-containing protein [Novosphingobium sp.]|uniref:RlpA-like double-psi beta-barrel domain-containing protein n=1 Tax=Novosphingobium sp. TaxID=1874826 RepID=UPI0027337723|nr:RlpA-like double-psi beta-barrel domain-containing protein [Novosphingobium sp.]MDP3551331.1 SPOR domain-containing protein [Novosphingobium sp.]